MAINCSIPEEGREFEILSQMEIIFAQVHALSPRTPPLHFLVPIDPILYKATNRHGYRMHHTVLKTKGFS